MTVEQIAARLAELCRKADFETAQKELYADDIVSIEPYATPDFEKETKGLNNIIEKGRKFGSMVEASYGTAVSTPQIAGNVIAFVLTMDIKMKGKDRAKMDELCVYHVKDGKVISEQFFM
ncbi:MAG TPA: SnoaL-like domain-containing protein [Chitinophaga sp.]|uniref:SnoaL-like domain-containing protein n=1 Tax=Chitinophaga sp. TaxID=1869181 RepID=UPI002D0CE1CC|nr:SnoaL-like domain-containing protein [Chitinophaga sp.]HVI45761.1 SnoaL-like domain-containing protein [Chitinophaga sp.]